MAKNHKGDATRITIFSAAAAVTSGVAHYEGGFAGIPITSAAIGQSYDMFIDGEFALPNLSGAVQGDLVYITVASDVLAAAAGTGLRPLGKVTRAQGAEGVPTGFMWVRIAPFAWSATA